ncbi:glutaredoxin family protein [Streptomyces montanisoli]|uniref:Glutaredoxin family protein n=1 Tax=Streptomyces montanisoli TaxID=2798581 RepID=A0A940MCY6_9ACTN|nr:glutaredoxin family protein [Streptomyces montanisoli]MBP0460709.1 glutaredoxin family protein [Streptomyces montanisoli]
MTPLMRRRKKDGDGDGEDRGAGARAARVRTVTLLSKPGCHLCDDARAVVERVCAQTGARWEEKDINEDEALREAHWEQIPVVFVDGEQHTFWRVDEARLRRELAGS